MYRMDNGYIATTAASTSSGVRPVLSINGNVTISGDGSISNPFKVID